MSVLVQSFPEANHVVDLVAKRLIKRDCVLIIGPDLEVYFRTTAFGEQPLRRLHELSSESLRR
jgi:hypothetical protein